MLINTYFWLDNLESEREDYLENVLFNNRN